MWREHQETSLFSCHGLSLKHSSRRFEDAEQHSFPSSVITARSRPGRRRRPEGMDRVQGAGPNLPIFISASCLLLSMHTTHTVAGPPAARRARRLLQRWLLPGHFLFLWFLFCVKPQTFTGWFLQNIPSLRAVPPCGLLHSPTLLAVMPEPWI